MAVKRILLAEDDRDLRGVYKRILATAGVEIEEAVDGLEALAKMKAGGYDLVLLDIMLLKKDGLEILEELAKDKPVKPNKAIVAVTNLSSDPIMDQVLRLGAKECLNKSGMSPEKLIELVNKY